MILLQNIELLFICAIVCLVVGFCSGIWGEGYRWHNNIEDGPHWTILISNLVIFLGLILGGFVLLGHLLKLFF